ncbi:MAG: EAL domain-containing protein [Treponema sp.]|nr:EAL domain-containing protein [Treponema sp.]
MDFINSAFGNIRNFMIFASHIQLQLVSLVFLGILEITYFHRQKLPVLSTFTFTAMMVFALLFVLSDSAVILSTQLYFRQFRPVRILSQFRIYAFLSVTVAIYLYVYLILGKKQSLTAKEAFKILGLYGISIIVIICAQIRIKSDTNGIYSYRIMNLFINGIALAFATMTIIGTINYSLYNPKSFFRGKRNYIFLTTGIWIFISIIQIIHPETVISSLGITAMCFIMYLGMETPGDFVDHETGALNATAMRLVLENLASNKRQFFILNIDLEDYDSIEEKFGEDIANQLIANVSNFATKEFKCPVFRAEPNSVTIIALHNRHNERCMYVDTLLNAIKKRMDKSWQVGDNSFYLSAHCDFICFPSDVPKDISIHELMHLVDDWHSYSEETGFVRQVNPKLVENRNRESHIVQLVSDAITNDGIEMYYQPIYDIKEKKFSNFEALVRLKDTQTMGFVSPEEFIPIAEKHGLIMKLSEKIFNQVFDFVSREQLAQKGLTHMEVNLSGLQSVDAALPQQMTGLLKKYNLEPSIVNLEITESIAITSSYMLKKNMDELKKIGCTFSMDDFGTGYSNLSQMAKVDYELIKIDKSLLWPCFDEKNPGKQNATIILENMIMMILNLGKKIVVEGVETKEQYEYLEKKGVTYIQGYYFSKPLPASQYIEFLESRKQEND